MQAEMVGHQHQVRPGDLVTCMDHQLSAGLELAIGTVSQTKPNRSHSAVKDVTVRLLVNPKDLDTVYVLGKTDRSEP